jgi:(4S)-4-hydroxy-5-phosphonooxypentane-2,3-dione isomerase
MLVTIVSVHVKEAHINDFIQATIANHQASVREPGNLRFDVLQQAGDPTRFTLYEAYASDADAAAHKETSHYQTWRAAVEPWMASPRVGVKHAVIAPAERKAW